MWERSLAQNRIRANVGIECTKNDGEGSDVEWGDLFR